jgi:hypothetical protein
MAMKRILTLSMTLILAVTGMAAAHGEHHTTDTSKTVTMTGEVLDMNCFMIHPANATGPDHTKCAQSCMAKGMPVGFKSSDGTVYLLLNPEHESINAKVAAFAGKKSTITGIVQDHDGVKALELVSITAAK